MADDIKNILQGIGLTKEQVEIYLAGLELGETSVQNLAKKANIKRPTTYLILDELKEKGLFSYVLRGKKRYFLAENPDKLFASVKQKEIQLKQIMPELKSLFNIDTEKPKIRYYEGINGALSVYDDILASIPNHSEILSYTGIAGLYKDFPKDFAKDFFNRRVQRQISTRIIAIDSEESREWQKHAPFEMRDIILVPENQVLFFGDTEIYGNKVALISYKENFMAVVIESKEIATMQRFIFELAWKKLKE
ncbi:MAG: helix-turn-helix domain-containing protein [Candidatus Buchananbacteria bacterium]